MKYNTPLTKIFFPFFFGILFLLSSCTRDDICAQDTPKTPLVILRFYNADNPLQRKATTNFTVRIPGEEGVLFEPVSIDSIALPLKTIEDITQYEFINNALAEVPNIDQLTFTYERENEFISRACSFRTNYTNLIVTKNETASSPWIDFIEILTDSINARNQNAAHIKIYH